MRLDFDKFSEVSRIWWRNFMWKHYPVVNITIEKGTTFLNIDYVLYDYILRMEDKEIEEYLD